MHEFLRYFIQCQGNTEQNHTTISRTPHSGMNKNKTPTDLIILIFGRDPFWPPTEFLPPEIRDGGWDRSASQPSHERQIVAREMLSCVRRNLNRTGSKQQRTLCWACGWQVHATCSSILEKPAARESQRQHEPLRPHLSAVCTSAEKASINPAARAQVHLHETSACT